MLVLDLFSGLGGASRAMRERGWDVVTVDIEPAFQPDIVADLRAFEWTGPAPDLLWASPPCEEFSKVSMPWCLRQMTGPPDLSLVQAARRLARQSGARYWIIENVRGAQRFLGKARWVRNPIFLWGHFPPIHHGALAPWKERLSSDQAAERAMIPYSLSEAVAESIESALPYDAVA